ncbi:sigma-70 family RNA polymerase sigma factor [Bacillus infantis]|uniref:sigma-70 family RNA polymerase sigma factor n=1 Tax=Bacillus infantis TaxID=324767 RepID=UPI003CF36361
MDRHDTISELMDQYGTDVLHLAYSYVRNRQTAEDLAQEIFIKCYENLNSFQGKSGLQTWLYRIAVNHCKDYLKSWHHRKMVVGDFVTSVFQSSPEKELMEKAERDEVLEEVFQLPVKIREIIYLYYFQECTQKEISDICKINLNTVKARVARGKKLLKEAMSERRGYDGKGNAKSEKPHV